MIGQNEARDSIILGNTGLSVALRGALYGSRAREKCVHTELLYIAIHYYIIINNIL